MIFYILSEDKQTETYIETIKRSSAEGRIKPAEIHVYGSSASRKADCVIYHNENGISFLTRYLGQVSEAELQTEDQLIPSHEAPHVLAEVMTVLLEGEDCECDFIDYTEKFGVPFEEDLQVGIKAISLFKETSMRDCLDAKVCEEKSFRDDLGQIIEAYAEKHSCDLISFKCSNYLDGIGTIPVKYVVSGWLRMAKTLSKGEKRKFLITTHSTCCGLAALVSASKKS